MINTLKKVSASLLVVITAVLTIFGATTVDAAPSTISMGNSSRVTPLIDGVSFDTKVMTDGTLVFCMDYNKAAPKNTTLTLSRELDAGMTYIVANGYGNKYLTGNGSYDYYITQSAVWWYLDETTGSNNLSASFKAGNNDTAGLIGYIRDLVNGAVAANNNGYTVPTINTNTNSDQLLLSADGKSFISQPISVTGNALDRTYKVSITSNVTGASIVNESLNKQNEFNVGETFRVMIDVNSVNNYDVNTVSVKVDAGATVNKVYEYVHSSSYIQRVVGPVLYPEKTDVSTTRSFTYQKEKGVLYVIKKDESTDQGLAGATMVLKDATGNVLYEWVTGTGATEIKGVTHGTYTVEEIKAPEGYVLSDEIKTIVFDDNNLYQVVEFYNTKEEEPEEKGSIIIVKRDKDTEEILPGATMVLRDATGKEITRWVTTTEAKQYVDVPYGTYTIEEIQAPEGYELSNEKITITINDIEPDQLVTFYNLKITKPTVEVVKKDEVSGEFLSGATMVLKDATGNIVETWITTGAPKIFTDLTPGTYTIEETQAPAGYELSGEIITFEVTEEIKHQVIDYFNKKTAVVTVPDTASAGTILFTILGLAIIAGGIGFTIYNAKKTA